MTTNQNGKSSEPVMRVLNVGKRYSRSLKHSLWYGVRDIAREVLLRREQTEGWTREGEFWAVSEVSFDLHPGDALALIGPNGAGKSTLLKMLSGLIKPDTGRIHVHGRTGALIELGAGFDPVLSGRENIHVSAAVLGFSRGEIADMLPKIVAFSELEEFIDSPVKYYSSGMNARLSFSVAAHLNPTIFLVDEVLAVGDIDFQRKCINHMLHYLSDGGALILVSHSPYLIQSVCNRGIYIDKGRVQFAGTAVDALNYYLRTPVVKSPESGASAPHVGGVARRADPAELSEAKPAAIDEISIGGDTSPMLTTGELARIKIKFRVLKEMEICWGFVIATTDQWVNVTGSADFSPRSVPPGGHELVCALPQLPMIEGSYMLKVALMEAGSRQPLDLFGFEDAPLAFEVHSSATFLNNALRSINQLVAVDVRWESCKKTEATEPAAAVEEPSPPEPAQNGGSVEGALELALNFLHRSQKPGGEFPLFRTWFEKGPREIYDSVPFATALIAYCLSFSDSPLVRPMIARACAKLRSEMEPFGIWRYWPPPRQECISVIPDTDDTAVISLILQRNGVKIPNNRRILLSNRNREGLFHTWIIARKVFSLSLGYWWTGSEKWRNPYGPTLLWQTNAEPDDVDGVVNANILWYLGPGPESTAVCQYLIKVFKEQREEACDKWYPNRFSFYNAVARNFSEGFSDLGIIRDEMIARIVSASAADGAIGSSALDTAQGVCALLSLNSDVPELHAAVQNLVRTQRKDGEWPYVSYYFGGHNNFSAWGSPELTTAFCLQALCRYAQRAGK